MPRPKGGKRRLQLQNMTEAKKTKKLGTPVTSDPEISASRKKIEALNSAGKIDDGHQQVWMIVNVCELTKSLKDVSCPECRENGLSYGVCVGENSGFSLKYVLKCDHCAYKKFGNSSSRVQGSERTNDAFEVNQQMTLFSHETGGSHAILQTSSTVMGIPGMSLSTFQKHDKKVTAAEISSGSALLERSAAVIREAYAETDEDLRETLRKGENPVIIISVSFDETWHKRGYTSLTGVGIYIDILTGLVVDFCVLSKYCHACKFAEVRGLSAAELAAWKEEHAPDCCKNHSLSSKAMESEAAKILWGRSVDRFGFRYMEMLSDGDSSAYKAVCSLNPYPDYEQKVEKLDCLNHAHKRLGTALRKLAKEERLGGRGLGRLTEAKCDKLQTFYRQAIVENIPNIENMRNAIWAGLWHSMSTDTEPQHRQCPKGKNIWCFYQRALANNKKVPSHKEHPSSTYLTTQIAYKLIPVYRRMADEELLRRMLHGGTQNNNECLNSMIWSRCPKTAFMGFKRVEGSVARAVCAFNKGAFELISLMRELYVDVHTITLTMLTKKDEHRVSAADAATSADARKNRKEYARQRRLNFRHENTKDGNTYEAGGH